MSKEIASRMAGRLHRVTLRLGDNIDRMSSLEDGSVDAVVCDPPYG